MSRTDAMADRRCGQQRTSAIKPPGYISAGFMNIGGSLWLARALTQIKCSKG
jgi:hypothetical protein